MAVLETWRTRNEATVGKLYEWAVEGTMLGHCEDHGKRYVQWWELKGSILMDSRFLYFRSICLSLLSLLNVVCSCHCFLNVSIQMDYLYMYFSCTNMLLFSHIFFLKWMKWKIWWFFKYISFISIKLDNIMNWFYDSTRLNMDFVICKSLKFYLPWCPICDLGILVQLKIGLVPKSNNAFVSNFRRSKAFMMMMAFLWFYPSSGAITDFLSNELTIRLYMERNLLILDWR